jgi:hypothetical protein
MPKASAILAIVIGWGCTAWMTATFPRDMIPVAILVGLLNHAAWNVLIALLEVGRELRARNTADKTP